MQILNYEPKRVFHHFAAISKIPRGSGNEEAVSDFIAKFAEKLGLDYVQDSSHNLIIYKDGTPGYEDSPPVILQGHLDMVCEKNADTVHDFLKDPIKLYVDGDYLKADGTTLGADNGIAVAYCMALLEAKDIPHPPLEVVLTSDEEAGMTGAMNLNVNMLKGRRMVNMDSGSVGCFTAGSAAASTAEYEFFVKWEAPRENTEAYTLTVKGLQGGHSGGDINKGRGNAICILGIVLNAIERAIDNVRISNLAGGMKVNAIPREAQATIVISPSDKEILTKAVDICTTTLKTFFRVADPGLKVALEPAEMPEKVIANDEKLSYSMLLFPYGMLAMSIDIDDLVASSCNIGVIETFESDVRVSCMARGATKEYLSDVEDKIIALACLAGADIQFGHSSPAWDFNPDSEILKQFASYYKEQVGEEPKVIAMHGGLECGIFAEKLPGLDIVAIGPNMYDLHTPQERLSISSTAVIWKFLCGVLGTLK
ncbi:MAG: aminoacyl-histidine dipeptidase [Defluviitaleaceae bacterium]|nr:aminoacyl-histidine dipeptidase [Defluviitaleaceae bacterium]